MALYLTTTGERGKKPSLSQEKGPSRALGFSAASTMRSKFPGLRMPLSGRVQAVYDTWDPGSIPQHLRNNYKAVDLRKETSAYETQL